MTMPSNEEEVITMPALNAVDTARLAELEKIPVPQRNPAQKQEVAALEAKQNS
jgi:hypothetical protein